MFEFAISQNRRRRPSKRFLACVLVSFLFHVCGLLALIQFPELLAPGLDNWLKLHAPMVRLLEPKPGQEEERAWRTVTMLGNSSKMALPSEATLKKYLVDLNKRELEKVSPTVRFRLNQEALAAIKVEKPKPAPQQVLGIQEPKPAPLPPIPGDSADQEGASGRANAQNEIASTQPSGPSKSALSLSSGNQVDKSTQTPSNKAGNAAANVNSSSSAEAVKPGIVPNTSPPVPGQEMKTFSDQKAAIIQEGSGLFDTKGFPLKEYADLIVERIKGNWYIPTTLKHSRGRTTVIFYIDKDGRYENVKIVGSSGSESFDITALNAIINSNPFPPLPRGFPGDHIGAKFVFSYNESE
jgi:TonB family protein